MTEADDSSFLAKHTDRPDWPVLISVPHAGRTYPTELLDNLRIPPAQLIRLEDRYSDRLAVAAQEAGFPSIVATRPRAWIDLNRSVYEIDPAMIADLPPRVSIQPSRKVRGGLGLVPRRLSGAGNLWRGKWKHDDIVSRIETDHQPYHRQISDTLGRIRDMHGGAILLDIHSMPPLYCEQNRSVDFVVGDRFGRSAGSRYSELAKSYLAGKGFRTELNHPYSGGYILDQHGQPHMNVHAIQIEVNRKLYLDQRLESPVPAAGEIADLIAGLARMLARLLPGQLQLEAAE